jgi:hypothetical protein
MSKIYFLIILSVLIININCECDKDDVECHEKEKYKKGLIFDIFVTKKLTFFF